jgi:hypothetical protein
MASVHILFVNMCCRNAATHSLLNTNNKADIIMVQEPWYNKIGTTCSDTDPEGVNILGSVANPKWDCIYPKSNHGERCKVMAYRRISSTHFNITNRLDLSSCHHILTLDVHLGSSSFQVINIYHDTNHQGVLDNILNIKIDPPTPTITGGDFNTHSWSWSPPGICSSPWANRLEDWAIGQSLALASPPGAPTCRGKGNQRDTTIDLIWTNAAAILDDAFQEPTIDFAASMGSDHAGLWTTYQHVLESAINPLPQQTRYIIADNARELWEQRFQEVSPHDPPILTSTREVDQEALKLTQDIKQTCLMVFKVWKGFSPRGSTWWNDECDTVAAKVREAQDLETCKTASKNLRKEVRTAKRNWANKFLHDATPEHLWTAARWCFGH